jgi:hypothetical protein
MVAWTADKERWLPMCRQRLVVGTAHRERWRTWCITSSIRTWILKKVGPVVEELQYEINLYGVSFLLDVRWDDPFYHFELKRDKSDQRSTDHIEPVDFFDSDSLDRLLNNVRAYAKLTTRYNTWQVALNDTFTDAGFLWLSTEQFERKLNYLHVLLSKNGLNYYFELHFRAGGHTGNYYELLDTMNRPIPRSRTNFGPVLPKYASIVDTISGVWAAARVSGAGSGAAARVGGGSASSKLRVYEAIVDLLLSVRGRDIPEETVNSVSDLLREVKETLDTHN